MFANSKYLGSQVSGIMSRHLFELILAVRRKCQQSEERIQRELSLSPAEFNALLVMDKGAEITGCEFAERMALSPSRGSRVLDKLVTDGYARTRLSDQDRRTVLISLTAEGRKTRRRMFRHMETCENRICSSLDEGEVEQVRAALELLETALWEPAVTAGKSIHHDENVESEDE